MYYLVTNNLRNFQKIYVYINIYIYIYIYISIYILVFMKIMRVNKHSVILNKINLPVCFFFLRKKYLIENLFE